MWSPVPVALGSVHDALVMQDLLSGIMPHTGMVMMVAHRLKTSTTWWTFQRRYMVPEHVHSRYTRTSWTWTRTALLRSEWYLLMLSGIYVTGLAMEVLNGVGSLILLAMYVPYLPELWVTVTC